MTLVSRGTLFPGPQLEFISEGSFGLVEQCVYIILSHSCPLLVLVKVFKRIRMCQDMETTMNMTRTRLCLSTTRNQ